jgi:hypothetical protein
MYTIFGSGWISRCRTQAVYAARRTEKVASYTVKRGDGKVRQPVRITQCSSIRVTDNFLRSEEDIPLCLNNQINKFRLEMVLSEKFSRFFFIF